MKCCHLLQVRAGAEPRNLTVGDPAVVEVGPAMFSIPQVSQLTLNLLVTLHSQFDRQPSFFTIHPQNKTKKRISMTFLYVDRKSFVDRISIIIFSNVIEPGVLRQSITQVARFRLTWLQLREKLKLTECLYLQTP